MYETFYGLRERPFDLTSDPRFMLLTSKHREALTAVKYGLVGRKGLTLLIGEAGTGKSTVIRKALDQFCADGHRIGYLSNPTLTIKEFFEWLAVEFDLSDDAAASKARFLRELIEKLTVLHAGGRVTGLVVDEAQSLPNPLLEEIRLLSNIETATEKLFPVVLAAQPELIDRLNQPALRQLKQRVGLRSILPPLEGSEVAAYLAGRIQRAGGTPAQLFTREAVMAIAEFTRGIPRVISVVCDNALIHGLAVGRRPITRDIVEEICHGLDLKRVSEQNSRPALMDAGAHAGDVSLEIIDHGSPSSPEASRPFVDSASQPQGAIDPTTGFRTTSSAEVFTQFGPKRRFLWWTRPVSSVRGNSG